MTSVKKVLLVLSFLSLLFVGQGYAQRSSQDIQNTMDGLGSGAEDENARSFLEGEKKAAQAQESANKQYTEDQLNTLYSGAGGAEDQNAINYYEDQYEEQTGEEFSSPEKDTYTQEHGDGSLPESENTTGENTSESKNTTQENISEPENTTQETKESSEVSEESAQFSAESVFPSWRGSGNAGTDVAGVIGQNGDQRFLMMILPHITNILIKLVAPLLGGALLITGARFIYGSGDSDALEKSKYYFLYALSGSIIVLLSYSILKGIYFLLA